jgi:hypothetical protein
MEMADRQLDLFAGSGVPCAGTPTLPLRPEPADPASLDDAALLAAIPASHLPNGPRLAAEAGRRRLEAAIPVLQDYCHRFAGFGTERPLPEQLAALEALGAIGGRVATAAVATIIIRHWVQGPTLATAVAVAARLGATLPAGSVVSLLRHPDPTVRADACHLARDGAEVIPTLLELMSDLHQDVCMAAACALARLRRQDARPLLALALAHAPTVRAIEAIAPIADDECIVLLGRLARGASPDLAEAARAALEAMYHPTAALLLGQLQ